MKLISLAAECVPDRTDVQCLHRWQKVLDPKLVKGPWKKEVIFFGPSWSQHQPVWDGDLAVVVLILHINKGGFFVSV